MKRISIVTPCYNEEQNVRLLAERVKAVFARMPEYEFEHIFADNCSTDNTLDVLKDMAREDPRIKIIANARNFGQPRSVFNAVMAASGDAIIILAADLQDPPELIVDFVQQWRQGYQVVFGVRAKRHEAFLMTQMRKLYYRLLKVVSEDELVTDAGDFVLFDKAVQHILGQVKGSNSYIRGLLSSLGFAHTGVNYEMERRHAGKTKMNLFSLFVYGLGGFINHTMFPMRLATLLGLAVAALSLVTALAHLILTLLFHKISPPGIPTLIIGMFFFGGVQLFMLGFLGELVGAIFRQGKNLPLVIEKERINFDDAERP